MARPNGPTLVSKTRLTITLAFVLYDVLSYAVMINTLAKTMTIAVVG